MLNERVEKQGGDDIDDILRQRAERKERIDSIRVELAKTFGFRHEDDEDELAPRGTKYDPDARAYKPRSQFDDAGKLTSHAPAELHKNTPRSQLNEILNTAKNELAGLINSNAGPERISEKKKEVKELEEFVKRAMMKPKVIFDKTGTPETPASKIKVYGAKSRWLQRQFVYLIRIRMPRGYVRTFWPLANTHYYHGRLYFGTPPTASSASSPGAGTKSDVTINGAVNKHGSIDVKDEFNKTIGSAIIIDQKNAIVVYPKLPDSPLEKFVKTNGTMIIIHGVAAEKTQGKVMWADMMLDYNTMYWKSLFGGYPPEASDQVFINFMKNNVDIAHSDSEEIKLAIIAKYLALKSNYEIADLKAYLAHDPAPEPSEEAEVLAADVNRDESAISEQILSLEDEA